MCKLMGLSNISCLTRSELDKMLTTVRNLFSDQRDGFGFAYMNDKMKLYCEKYVKPRRFHGIGAGKYDQKLLGELIDYVDRDKGSTSYQGNPGKAVGPIIIHGRTSTNLVNIGNTHPFVKGGWALVHNGVIEYDGPKRDTKSTCDSEHLINSYVFGRGYLEFEEHFSGYAATLAISPGGTMIATKDDTAPLYIAIIPKWHSYIFASSDDHILLMCEKMKVTSTEPLSLKKNHVVICNGEKLMKVDKVKPLRTRTWNYVPNGVFGCGYYRNNDTQYSVLPNNSPSVPVNRASDTVIAERETKLVVNEQGKTEYRTVPVPSVGANGKAWSDEPWDQINGD